LPLQLVAERSRSSWRPWMRRYTKHAAAHCRCNNSCTSDQLERERESTWEGATYVTKEIQIRTYVKRDGDTYVTGRYVHFHRRRHR
jgi:hypothetical protein